ncbi:MAG: class I SAM-dependent methyltransferase [Parcubacteria group bacterium]|nr:class I SAM-dependent methyltransferase [Parcubacteria group bacterium]
MKFDKYRKKGAYHWKMYDEDRYYREHAHRIKEWVKEKNILDIGAGDGRITHLLGIIGVDDEPEAVRLAIEKGANVVLGDAYNLTYKDEEFDSVLLVDTLEHFEFPEKALKEARRVLKYYIYIATPPRGMLGRMDKYHYQEWTEEELVKFVEGQGFTLEGRTLLVLKEQCIYAKFKKL